MSEKNATSPNLPIVVLDGSPYGTPLVQSFATIDEAEGYIIERVRGKVEASLKPRLEKALVDQVVSEDGKAAVSSVIAGKLVFLRALAKAYAPSVAITERKSFDEDDKDGR